MLKNKNFKNFEQEVHNMNEVTNFLNEYDKIVSKYGTREWHLILNIEISELLFL
mgnify:CR=1 FL=1